MRHNPIPFSVLFGCISAFNKFPHSLFASGSQRFTAIRDEEEERLTVEASHNADREMRHLALEHAIEGIGQISTGDALELLQGGSSPGRHARRSTSTVSSRNSHRLAATRCARRGPSADTHGPANSIGLDPAQSSIFVTPFCTRHDYSLPATCASGVSSRAAPQGNMEKSLNTSRTKCGCKIRLSYRKDRTYVAPAGISTPR